MAITESHSINNDSSLEARRAFAEKIAGPEWADWYLLTPEERWSASQKLWSEYLALGGSLDPEVDFQSPFWTADDYRSFAQRSIPERAP